MAKKSGGFSTFLRIIGLIMLVPMVLGIYTFFSEKPEVVGTTYINGLSTPGTPIEDRTTFLNINLMKNTDNSGDALFEVAFNTQMTPTDTTDIKTQGIQIKGGIQKTNWHAGSSIVNNSFFRTDAIHFATWDITNKFYFDSSQIGEHVETMVSMNEISNDTKFMLSTQQYDVLEHEYETTPVALSFKVQNITDNLYIGETNNWLFWSFYEKTYYEAGLDNFLISLEQSCQSLDVGTHYLYLDLSNWFNVYLYNTESKEYDKLTTDVQYTYVLMKVNVSNVGATKNAQSMFGLLAKENGTFEFDDVDSAPFWQYINNYTITNENFAMVEDYSVGGYVLHLDSKTVEYLSQFKKLRIHVNIDLSTFSEEIKAIDCSTLNGLEYFNITITSDSPQSIELISAKNLVVETLNHNSNVELIYSSDLDFNVGVI